ncbi:prepilin peptidase [Amycolatopsis sp. NPDC047767]|uniref:prepilin peptidase n=1 Tax=Amycolatopsis sp. NPDC047767 TaxID=3156765 RepID=UPI00345302EF
MLLGVLAGSALAPIGLLVARSTAHTELSRRHKLLLTAAAALGGAACSLWPAALLAPATLTIVLAIPATAIDALEHRIPNVLSLLLAAGVPVTLVCACDLAQFLRVLGGAAAWGGLLLAAFLATGEPGPGDIKLAPSLGMLASWGSWQTLVTAVVATYLLAAVVGLIGVIGGRISLRAGRIALGPAMVAATVAAVTVSSCIRT